MKKPHCRECEALKVGLRALVKEIEAAARRIASRQRRFSASPPSRRAT